MRNIFSKIGAFFEAHVEKIVLGVAGVLSLWLLMVFVVISPNKVEYDRQTLAPGQIDSYINSQKASQVKSLLNAAPSTGEGGIEIDILSGPIDGNNELVAMLNRDLPGGFNELFLSPIGHIDSVVQQPILRNELVNTPDDRKYELPYVGEVTAIMANHIRAAAYFPLDEVTQERSYEQVGHEPNDLDLVTIQAKFDVATLRARFHESFASEGLPKAWRDEDMAEPVFAAVNLQRQEHLDNGNWGMWEDVPRARVQPQSGLFSIIEDVQSLPAGGISVLKLRLNDPFVRADMLQPPSYSIASTYEEWLPPEFHEQYAAERRKEEAQKRRDEREAERDADNRDSNRRRTAGGQMGQGIGGIGGIGGGFGGMGGNTANQRTRGGNRGGAGARGDRGAGVGGRGGAEAYGGAGQQRTRGGNRGATRGGGRQDDPYGSGMGLDGRGGGTMEVSPMAEIVNAYEEIRLSPMNDFSRMDEIVFWAHDDTVEPGKVYRYRIRLGVINPIAGTSQVSTEDTALKNKAILWSDFSDITGQMEIPERLYFFPTVYQDMGGSVSVEVAKFEKGYWRSETFPVRPGESIGREVEVKDENEDETQTGYMPEGGLYARGGMIGLGQPQEPQTIDFSTDVVLIGASRIDGWTGSRNLRSQTYYEMLYSEDGVEIQRMPIGPTNWPTELRTAQSQVRVFQKEPVEDFRSFGSSDLTGLQNSGMRGGEAMRGSGAY